MRNHTLAAVLFAAVASAQSPLTTTFANNNGGSAGGAVYFDLDVTEPNGITITSVEINTGAASGTMELYTVTGSYVPNAANSAVWTLAASGLLQGAGVGNPSPVCLGAGAFLPMGQYGISLTGMGIDHRYTNAAGTFPTVYSTNELTLTAGAASNAPFGGATFTPRVWNGRIYYAIGNVPGTGCPGATLYGEGCYFGVTSFYEQFADLQSAFDFAGAVGNERVIEAAAIGVQGYAVTNGVPAWFTPLGPPLSNNGVTPGTLSDNQYSQPINLPFTFSFPGGSTNVVHASSNGDLLLGSTVLNGTQPTPSALELLSRGPRLCPLWCDLHASLNASTNPQSGVHADVDPSGTTVYVTWLDVADVRGALPAAGATSVNVQIALHGNGSFAFRYGVITAQPAGTGQVLTGWSKGNISGINAVDPGPVDLSASFPLLTTGPDSLPLEHTVGLPQIGNNFTLSVANVENVAPIAIVLAGDMAFDPGLPLAAIGAPGCQSYANILATATVPVTFPPGNGSLSLPIPNNALLIGAVFSSQYAALTLQNALNLSTSNGATWTIGN